MLRCSTAIRTWATAPGNDGAAMSGAGGLKLSSTSLSGIALAFRHCKRHSQRGDGRESALLRNSSAMVRLQLISVVRPLRPCRTLFRFKILTSPRRPYHIADSLNVTLRHIVVPLVHGRRLSAILFTSRSCRSTPARLGRFCSRSPHFRRKDLPGNGEDRDEHGINLLHQRRGPSSLVVPATIGINPGGARELGHLTLPCG